jgi:hypothetical protein
MHHCQYLGKDGPRCFLLDRRVSELNKCTRGSIVKLIGGQIEDIVRNIGFYEESNVFRRDRSKTLHPAILLRMLIELSCSTSRW